MSQQRQGDRSGDGVAAGQQFLRGDGEIAAQPRLVQLLERLPGEFEDFAGPQRIGDDLGEFGQVGQRVVPVGGGQQHLPVLPGRVRERRQGRGQFLQPGAPLHPDPGAVRQEGGDHVLQQALVGKFLHGVVRLVRRCRGNPGHRHQQHAPAQPGTRTAQRPDRGLPDGNFLRGEQFDDSPGDLRGPENPLGQRLHQLRFR